jgi:CHAT domain-containing protein
MLQEAVRDRERRIARLVERLALRGAGDLEPIVRPVAVTPVARPALDAETVILEYFVQQDALAIFVITNTGLMFVPVPLGSTTVLGLVRKWQLNLEATAQAMLRHGALDSLCRQARAILEALYRALVEPVVRLAAGRRRLVVIPYGPLHAVPFHALYDGRRHLLETFDVSTCPSSSLLRLCIERARRVSGTALVMAHSDGGRLPHVLGEADAVFALLGGERFVEEEATRAVMHEAAPRHGVVHLAAHGEARLDNPTFAHLKLADGQLSTADVFDLPLDGALVTLSACETGRSIVTGGDELVGLSRGFLSAGASTLVQSLWRIEDGSTARLMGRFYRALRAGGSIDKALQQAQLALLADRDVHPYFWAGFQVVGDGSRRTAG